MGPQQREHQRMNIHSQQKQLAGQMMRKNGDENRTNRNNGCDTTVVAHTPEKTKEKFHNHNLRRNSLRWSSNNGFGNPLRVAQIYILAVVVFLGLLSPSNAEGDFGIQPNGECPLVALLPFTYRGRTEEMRPSTLAYDQMAAFLLAVEHFNARDPSIVPALASEEFKLNTADGCNVTFPIPSIAELKNGSAISPISDTHDRKSEAAAQLLMRNKVSSTYPICAVIGPVNEEASEAVAPITGGMGIPLISHATSKNTIGKPEVLPLTLRTSPSNVHTATVILDYLSRHLGRDYIQVVWSGSNAASNALQTAATKLNMRINTNAVHPPFDDPTAPNSVYHAANKTKELGFRTVILTIKRMDQIGIFAKAADAAGMLDGGYLFVLTHIPIESIGVTFHVEKGSSLDKLLQGAAIISPIDAHITSGHKTLLENGPDAVNPDPFLSSWRALDDDFAERLNAIHPIRKPGAGYFRGDSNYFQENTPKSFSGAMYDTVISTGMGACRSLKKPAQGPSSGPPPKKGKGPSKPPPGTTNAFVDSIVESKFFGGSGYIYFTQKLGRMRIASSIGFGIFNIRPSEGNNGTDHERNKTDVPDEGDADTVRKGDAPEKEGSQQGENKSPPQDGQGPPPQDGQGPPPQDGQGPPSQGDKGPPPQGDKESSPQGNKGPQGSPPQGDKGPPPPRGFVPVESRQVYDVRISVILPSQSPDDAEERIQKERRGEDITINDRKWVEVESFIYSSGTVNQPTPIRDPTEANYLSESVRIAGLTLMSISLVLSIGSFVWVYFMRFQASVKAAQPEFLCLMCIGSTMISFAILTLSFDEGLGFSQAQLDAACIATPWLFCCGHMVVYLAIFCKLHRVIKVLQFRRKRVVIWNVMAPLVIFLFAAIVVLSLWSALDPWTWEREVINEVTGETYGKCESEHGDAFFYPLCFLMILSTLLALYMAYRAKDIPSDFSDAHWVFYAIFLSVQVWAVGLPVLALLQDSSANATYMSRTMLLFTFSTSTVILIIGPKVFKVFSDKRAKKGNTRRNELRGIVISRGNTTVSGLNLNNSSPAASRNVIGGIIRRASLMRSSLTPNRTPENRSENISNIAANAAVVAAAVKLNGSQVSGKANSNFASSMTDLTCSKTVEADSKSDLFENEIVARKKTSSISKEMECHVETDEKEREELREQVSLLEKQLEKERKVASSKEIERLLAEVESERDELRERVSLLEKQINEQNQSV